jgi:LPS export ABC transporter protein LptC
MRILFRPTTFLSPLSALCPKLVALSCVLIALTFFGCEEKIKPSVSNKNFSQSYPTQESWNSRITFSQDGKLAAIITGGHITVFDEKKETYLDTGVRVEFYNEQSIRTSVLTCNKAKINDLTRDMEAYENVVVVSDSDETTLRSQKLFWLHSKQLIHTTEYVEIDAPHEKIQGMGFESDKGLGRYKIFKVTGRVENIR